MAKRNICKLSALSVCLAVLTLSVLGVFGANLVKKKNDINQFIPHLTHYFTLPLMSILGINKQKSERKDSSLQFTSTDISLANELDSKDELRSFRNKFVITDPNTIYLDGNSLGRLPRSTIKYMQNVIENEWGEQVTRKHMTPRRKRVNSKLAQLVGAQPDEVLISDSTSVNFYKLIVAALQLKKDRTKIVSADLNFPTDVYILEGIIKLLGNKHELVLIPSGDNITIKDEAIQSEIDEETALVTFSHVAYKSGFLYDMEKVDRWAHEKGALVLWDLSHSVGAVPIDLNGTKADLAVGCTYKYLNGGSGCPAFLYVRKDLQIDLENPIWGWLGAQDPFITPRYKASPGVKKFMVGSPPSLSIAALEPALDIHLQAGMEKLRKKSIHQAAYLIYLAEQWLFPLGFELGSPKNPEIRGSHVALKHPEAYQIYQAMTKSPPPAIKVIPDFRPPDNIRMSVVPLYTSYNDVYLAMKRIREIVEENIYKQFSE